MAHSVLIAVSVEPGEGCARLRRDPGKCLPRPWLRFASLLPCLHAGGRLRTDHAFVQANGSREPYHVLVGCRPSNGSRSRAPAFGMRCPHEA
eukprot:5552695-Amphidinium_carterae.1